MKKINCPNVAKNLFILLIVSLVFAIYFQSNVYALTSDNINFQGKIVRNDTGYEGLNVVPGSPACVVDGAGNDTCDFQVAYYTASTGGTLLLTETFTNVEIGQYDGVFELSLGSGSMTTTGQCRDGTCNTPVEVISEYKDVYLELKFSPDGTNLTETFTRMPLEASPYAILSKYAEGANDAFKLSTSVSSGSQASPVTGMVYYNTTTSQLTVYNGTSWEGIKSSLWTDAGTFTYLTSTTDDLVLGASTVSDSTFFFDMDGSSGSYLEIDDASNTNRLLTILSGGNVGIGTATPGAKLEVAGSASTITNASGDLTISTGGLNGNILLSPNGSGSVRVSTSLGIRETGTTPTYYTFFQGGDQTGDISYTLPVNDGDSSEVLTTDGSGVLSWNTVASSSHTHSTLSQGTGIASFSYNGSATATVGFDYTSTLTSNSLGANTTLFGSTGILFEGSTSDTYETLLTVTNPTSSDKTITLPNASGTVALTSDLDFDKYEYWTIGDGSTTQNVESKQAMTISGGNGISAVLGGTRTVTVSTNATTCSVGQYSYWTGTAWLCRDDVDTDTTVSLVRADSTTNPAAVRYTGTTATNGYFYGGSTTAPSSNTYYLNFQGRFRATELYEGTNRVLTTSTSFAGGDISSGTYNTIQILDDSHNHTTTTLGASTVGSNLFTLTNPSAITFLRVNADNTVSALSASDFRTAIGAGTGSGSGSVTSVATGTGLTGGPITTTGTISLSYANTLASNSLAANNTVFGSTGILFEGSTSDTYETLLTVTNPTSSDKTITLPNASGTVALTSDLDFDKYEYWTIGDGSTTQNVASKQAMTISGGNGISAVLGGTRTVTVSTNATTCSVGQYSYWTGTAWLCRDDVDTDTNTDTNDYVDFLSFNTSDGVLTLGRTGALADLTTNFDGRYALSGAGMPSGTEGQMLYNNAGAWTAFNGMFWDDTNNRLGVGTTGPTAKLEIVTDTSTTATALLVHQQENSGTMYGTYSVADGVGATNNIAGYFSSTGATNNYGLLVANGNVGIGTTTPSNKFVVNTSGYSTIELQYGGTSVVDIFSNASSNIFIGLDSGSVISTGTGNIALGDNALSANTTGLSNTAIGHYALDSNVAKQGSTALGYQAMMYANSTATAGLSYNTAIGYQALTGSGIAANNTGTQNTAVGHQSMTANTSGSSNTALGVNTLNANTTGTENVAIGQNALFTNVAKQGSVAIGYEAMRYANNTATANQSFNTAVGYQALMGSSIPANNLGDRNTVFGYQSGMNMTSGGSNTLMGVQAGYSNTTGYSNVAIGADSLSANATGTRNVVIGQGALGINATGDHSASVAIGYYSMGEAAAATVGNVGMGAYSLFGVSGNYNTALGYGAGQDLTNGSYNILIGYNVQASTITSSNELNIGNTIYGNLSNDYISIGDSTPTEAMFTVGATSQFRVDTNGDLTRIKNVPYTWPSSNLVGVLTNDGSGNLSWDDISASLLPTGTEGQMIYNNAGTWTAYSGMYWDDVNNRLGVDGDVRLAGELSSRGYLAKGHALASQLNLASGISVTGSGSGLLSTDGAKTVGSTYLSFSAGNGSDTGPENSYLQIDLGQAKTVSQHKIYFYNGDNRYYWFKLKYSYDGVNWHYAIGNPDKWATSAPQLPGVGTSGSIGYVTDITVDSVNAQYWRLYANGNTINTSNHIYEWEIFQEANPVALDIDDRLYVGGKVGIGTTSADFALQVNGVVAPETTDQDLGTAALRWDLNASSINADNTVTFSSLGAGATNTVVTHNSGVLQTRTIDSRVWGSSLVDGSGTTNYVTKWTDANTLGTGIIFDNGTNVGIGATVPATNIHLRGATVDIESVTYAGGSLSTDWNQNALLKIDQAESGGNAMAFSVSGTANERKGYIQVGHTSGNYSYQLGSLALNPFGGNVGIGTTSPGTKLQISNQSAFNTSTPGAGLYGLHFSGQTTAGYASGITWNGGESVLNDANAGIYVQGSGSYGTKMYFATTNAYVTGSQTRMMIDQNGNVGIGISPSHKLHVSGNSLVTGNTYFGDTTTYIRNSLSALELYASSDIRTISGSNSWFRADGSAYFDIDSDANSTTQNFYWRTGTPTAPTYLMQLNEANILYIGRTAGNSNIKSSADWLIMDSNTSPAALNYFTDQDVMLAYGGGQVAIGRTAVASTYQLLIRSMGATSSTYSMVARNSDSVNSFWINDAGGGYLRAASWTYGSDIRIKENISSIEYGLDEILQLNPVHFDYITGGKNNLGFIAQDVQTIIPEAVDITDPETGMLGLKQDFIIPVLVKAMQEQDTVINTLTTRVSNLEGVLKNETFPIITQGWYRISQLNGTDGYAKFKINNSSVGSYQNLLLNVDTVSDKNIVNIVSNFTSGGYDISKARINNVDGIKYLEIYLEEVNSNSIMVNIDGQQGDWLSTSITEVIDIPSISNEFAFNGVLFGISDVLQVEDTGLKVGGDLIASTTTANIGDTTSRWNDIYAKGAIRLGSGSGQEGAIRFNTESKRLELSNDGSTWVQLGDLTSQMVISPEYPGAILFADGSDNLGKMTSDAIEENATFKNYYEWISNKEVAQDYDILVRITLPNDFVSWKDDAIYLDYMTQNSVSVENNSVDVTLIGNSGVDAQSVDHIGTLPGAWERMSLKSLDINDCNAPGDSCTLRISLTSSMEYFTRVGDITLNYNRSL